jgi:hypothetical protein
MKCGSEYVIIRSRVAALQSGRQHFSRRSHEDIISNRFAAMRPVHGPFINFLKFTHCSQSIAAHFSK